MHPDDPSAEPRVSPAVGRVAQFADRPGDARRGARSGSGSDSRPRIPAFLRVDPLQTSRTPSSTHLNSPETSASPETGLPPMQPPPASEWTRGAD